MLTYKGLTKKELNEKVGVTIGRLREAIRSSKSLKRQLELLDKISDDIIQISIKHPKDDIV